MEMSQYTRLALATGGGIVESNENWGVLRHGIVVHLDMKPEDIYARLIAAAPEEIAKRPLLASSDPLAKLQVRCVLIILMGVSIGVIYVTPSVIVAVLNFFTHIIYK